MKSLNVKSKRVLGLLLSSAAIVSFGFASAKPQLAQTGRPTSPTQPQSEREPTGTTQTAVPGIDDHNRIAPTPRRPQWRLTPATPSRSATTLDDLKKNLEELQTINSRLQQAIDAGQAPDYDAIVGHAEAIERLARCMQSTTGLQTPSAGESRSQQRNKGVVTQDLSQLASAIGKSIAVLVNSPVVRQLNIVDAELITEADVELRKITSLSAELRKQAEAQSSRLATTRVGTASSRGTAGSKSNYKRPPYLQLTLDCGVWTADRFLQLPAKVKTDWPIKIEGREIQVKHHKLAERQLIFIEECMPCSFDEKAIAAGEQYAVSLRDFYSFLVQGKPFAYHALYQIVRIKDGKITKRLDQPVSLYYIDAAGLGEFELAQGTLARLPEWIKDPDPRR